MFRRIKTTFLVYVGALIVCGMMLSTIFSYTISKKSMTKMIEDRYARVVHSLTDTVTMWVHSILLTCSDWSEQDVFIAVLKDFPQRDTRHDSANKVLEKYRKHYDFYESINILDLDGKTVCSSEEKLIGKSNVIDKLFFEEAIDLNKHISSIFKSEYTGKYVIAIAVPVFIDFDKKGVLLGIINLKKMSDLFISSSKIGKTGYCYIVDKDGNVLAHPIEKKIGNMNLFAYAPGREIMSKKEGFMSYSTDGVKKMIFFRRDDYLDWVVVAGAPTKEIFASVNWVGFVNIINTLFFIVIAVVGVAVLYNRVIAKQIKNLISGISKYGKTKERFRMEETFFEEFNEIAISFNRMADNLEHSMVSIEDLELSQKRFEDVVEATGDWIWELDPKGRYTYSSGMVKRVLGYSPEEIIGKYCYEFFDESTEEAKFQKAVYEIFARNQKKISFRNRLVKKNGDIVVVETNGVAIFNAENKIIGYRGVDRDITKRVEEEEERILLEKDLQQSKKLESIGTLAAGIAHEINTPIQFIGDNIHFLGDALDDLFKLINNFGGLLCLVAKECEKRDLIETKEKYENEIDLGFLENEVPECIHQTEDGLDRVSKIVNAMKSFSHISDEKKQLADINKAIESAVIVSSNEWKYSAEIKMNFDEQLPLVNCFVGDINQVIMNMILNATHSIEDMHSDSKGTITISTCCKEDKAVVISVSDTGKGIPEDIQDKIFLPFFTTKEVGKGTGQGLSMAYAIIVEKHGGKLTFESTLNKGTTFFIELPLSNSKTTT